MIIDKAIEEAEGRRMISVKLETDRICDCIDEILRLLNCDVVQRQTTNDENCGVYRLQKDLMPIYFDIVLDTSQFLELEEFDEIFSRSMVQSNQARSGTNTKKRFEKEFLKFEGRGDKYLRMIKKMLKRAERLRDRIYYQLPNIMGEERSHESRQSMVVCGSARELENEPKVEEIFDKTNPRLRDAEIN